MLPKYLQVVVNFSRRSDLTKKDVIALQKLVRKVRCMVDRLAQNGAPNRALKTSCKELLDAVESCSDKVLKRAIRTAVEEKSRYVAERIARTESARAWYQGFLKDTMDDSDIVVYRWAESIRHTTEDICDEYAKVDAYGLGSGIFPKDKAPELPAHPHCLCHYEKVYASGLDSLSNNSFTEQEQYGKSKNATVNHTYLNSGEYRRKFDAITDNPAVNRTLYQIAKKILNHRSGTLYEDMYWVDKNTGEIAYSITNSTLLKKIEYPKKLVKLIKENPDKYVTIHNHPESRPPSINDFNANVWNRYSRGVACCHNGKIYLYYSNEYIPKEFYEYRIAKYKKRYYNEEEAQLMALRDLARAHDIHFKEVKV